jgi:hypothetical protein
MSVTNQGQPNYPGLISEENYDMRRKYIEFQEIQNIIRVNDEVITFNQEVVSDHNTNDTEDSYVNIETYVDY